MPAKQARHEIGAPVLLSAYRPVHTDGIRMAYAKLTPDLRLFRCRQIVNQHLG